MGDRVQVRVLRRLEDMPAGSTAWVEENERVTGMVDGGYWEIIGRKAPRVKVKAADGDDQA